MWLDSWLRYEGKKEGFVYTAGAVPRGRVKDFMEGLMRGNWERREGKWFVD